MLIATWNVNSLRARLPRVLELIEKHSPDVILLQETKCSPANFPREELAAAGYGSVEHSVNQWAGVAILARAPHTLSDPQLGLPGEPVPAEARWVEATVDGIRFVSTYVHNGRAVDHPEYANKLRFLAVAAERVSISTGDWVIAGDFNIAPTDEDVWDPDAVGTHVTAPEREALTGLLAAGHLADAYRRLHPDEPQYTWWDYRAGNFHKNLGMRIDLTLLSEPLAERLSICEIDRDLRKGQKPSDHAPLLVTLR